MVDQDALLAAVLVFVFVAYALLGRRKRRGNWRRPTPEVRRDIAAGAPQGHVSARVARVIDGDTVDVTIERCVVRIRLDSIDCPEDEQHWGDIATAGLIKMIGGRTVRLECHGVDVYGRTLATIYVLQNARAKPVNVNERMVALGHAWVMRRYYNHLPRHRRASLNRIEGWAKSKRVGLWQTDNPIPPWKWRASRRNGFG